MIDLYQEMSMLHAELIREVETLKQAGKDYAFAESEYRKILRLAILEERSNGTPVTLTSDLCRGREEVANAKCTRDCAEAMYKSAQEAINVLKLKIRTIDSQITREWSSGGGDF